MHILHDDLFVDHLTLPLTEVIVVCSNLGLRLWGDYRWFFIQISNLFLFFGVIEIFAQACKEAEFLRLGRSWFLRGRVGFGEKSEIVFNDRLIIKGGGSG